MTGSPIRFVLGTIALITIALTHQLLAQPDPGGWGPMTCEIEIDGETVSDECDVTFEDCASYCEEYIGLAPPLCVSQDCDGARGRGCLTVCGLFGQPVDVMCVCTCDGNEPTHDLCGLPPQN